MTTNNICTPMFIIAFFLFIVGLLTIFNVIGNTLSTILFITLFVISIIFKVKELWNKNQANN
jgi:predicted membrane protein